MAMRGAAENLRVLSVTGVDLELRIAGLGGRSYAFILDWHIRIALAIAWYGLSGLFLYGDLLPPPGDLGWDFFLIVGLPALVIYALYHPILEVAMRGRTPGKRLAGVRIVDVDGHVPAIGELLIRNLLRVVDSLPSFYAVGLIATLTTHKSMRIGDLAAGTLLVYEEADTGPAVFEEAAGLADGTGENLERRALAHELLGRWDHLTPAAREALAVRLLDEDRDALTDAELKQRIKALGR